MNNYNYTEVIATSIIASALFLKQNKMRLTTTFKEDMESCIDDAFELCDKIFDKVVGD